MVATEMMSPGVATKTTSVSKNYAASTRSDQSSMSQESWDISIIDAFISTFVPSYGAPPAAPIDELIAQEKQKA